MAQHNSAVAAAQFKGTRQYRQVRSVGRRWESEVQRLTSVSGDQVINPQILAESQKQLKTETATREAAKDTALAAEANEQARKADVEKAKVDVEAASAKAPGRPRRRTAFAALVSYTQILAPYDGIVIARNANTGDYVQPGTGSLSTVRRRLVHRRTQRRANLRGGPHGQGAHLM